MMPLTLAEVGEENIIRKIGGKQEVKTHLYRSQQRDGAEDHGLVHMK